MKLEVNHKKKSGRTTNIWRKNNMLLNNEWVNQKIKEEIKKNTWKQIKIHGPKPVGYSKSSSKREAYSNTGLPQEARKISNKQPNFILKRARKRTTKPKASRRKEIIMITAEINDTEPKKQ